LAWFAIVLPLLLTITKPGAPFIEATVRYFSFFAILTNILVALALTLPACARYEPRAFFTRPSVHGNPDLHHHRRGDLSLCSPSYGTRKAGSSSPTPSSMW
jgi:hypothetical protein